MPKKPNVVVLGTGYVGLVAGVCLAECGHRVICVDRDERKVAELKAGRVPIYEPGLEEVMRRNTEQGRLSFTTDTAESIQKAYVIILAVGTPPKADGESDLSQVTEAAEIIGQNIQPEGIVMVKSTVPVGTTRRVKEIIAAQTSNSFHVGFNPEFLREGSALDDFMTPTRTVVGCESPKVADIMRELYAPFISESSPYLVTDIHSAELIKYASNAMLATRISFMNNLATVCEKAGADIEAVKLGMGYDDRIGSKFLNPGIGVGGSCFPKDLKSLIHTGLMMDEPMPILRAVLQINSRMPALFVQKIRRHFGDVKGLRFGVWGLAFKPNTDDMREAPSIIIINELIKHGATLTAYDPAAMQNARLVIDPKLRYVESAEEAIQDVDALLLLTEWNEFKNPDIDHLKDVMKQPVVFDGRNLYEPERFLQKGFVYYAVGRGNYPQPKALD